MERRYFNGECRSQDIDGQKYLVGYAAKFGVQSHDLGGFREVIERRAFDRAINEKQNVTCVVDHDRARVLGTTKAGTLSLTPDDTGLAFRCLLPDTSYARDCSVLTQRGDAASCSFAFKAPRGGDKWGIEQGVNVRHLIDVDLFDVSVGVVNPCYPDTEVALRSMEEWRAQERDEKGRFALSGGNGKFKEGDRVTLKEDKEEGLPMQHAHYLGQDPSGKDVHIVELAKKEKGDDGLREVGGDQIVHHDPAKHGKFGTRSFKGIRQLKNFERRARLLEHEERAWSDEARAAAAEARKKTGEADKSSSKTKNLGGFAASHASLLGKGADTKDEHHEAAAAHNEAAKEHFTAAANRLPGFSAHQAAGMAHLDAAAAHNKAASMK